MRRVNVRIAAKRGRCQLVRRFKLTECVTERLRAPLRKATVVSRMNEPPPFPLPPPRQTIPSLRTIPTIPSPSSSIHLTLPPPSISPPSSSSPRLVPALAFKSVGLSLRRSFGQLQSGKRQIDENRQSGDYHTLL